MVPGSLTGTLTKELSVRFKNNNGLFSKAAVSMSCSCREVNAARCKLFKPKIKPQLVSSVVDFWSENISNLS